MKYLTHSRYIKSSCSDYCPQRPHACTSWGQGGSLSPATGLCCAAETGGVWVVKLYLVNMKAHLGYGGCLGGLRVGGALPTAALTLPCSSPLNMPCTSYPPTGLRLNSSFCLECPPPTALTGKLLLILVNCCFFQEAFLGPTRNVYRAPETLWWLDSSSLIAFCLAHLQRVDLGDRAQAHPPGRALGLVYWLMKSCWVF